MPDRGSDTRPRSSSRRRSSASRSTVTSVPDRMRRSRGRRDGRNPGKKTVASTIATPPVGKHDRRVAGQNVRSYFSCTRFHLVFHSQTRRVGCAHHPGTFGGHSPPYGIDAKFGETAYSVTRRSWVSFLNPAYAYSLGAPASMGTGHLGGGRGSPGISPSYRHLSPGRRRSRPRTFATPSTASGYQRQLPGSP